MDFLSIDHYTKVHLPFLHPDLTFKAIDPLAEGPFDLIKQGSEKINMLQPASTGDQHPCDKADHRNVVRNSAGNSEVVADCDDI